MCREIISFQLVTRPPSELSHLVDRYSLTLSTFLNKLAPLKSKISSTKSSLVRTCSWETHMLANRQLELIWSQSHSAEDFNSFRFTIMLLQWKLNKFTTLHSFCLVSQPKSSSPLEECKQNSTPHHFTLSCSNNSLCSLFQLFHEDKIHKLHTSVLSNHTCVSPHTPNLLQHLTSHPSLVKTGDISKPLTQSPDTLYS